MAPNFQSTSKRKQNPKAPSLSAALDAQDRAAGAQRRATVGEGPSILGSARAPDAFDAARRCTIGMPSGYIYGAFVYLSFVPKRNFYSYIHEFTLYTVSTTRRYFSRGGGTRKMDVCQIIDVIYNATSCHYQSSYIHTVYCIVIHVLFANVARIFV